MLALSRFSSQVWSQLIRESQLNKQVAKQNSKGKDDIQACLPRQCQQVVSTISNNCAGYTSFEVDKGMESFYHIRAILSMFKNNSAAKYQQTNS